MADLVGGGRQLELIQKDSTVVYKQTTAYLNSVIKLYTLFASVFLSVCVCFYFYFISVTCFFDNEVGDDRVRGRSPHSRTGELWLVRDQDAMHVDLAEDAARKGHAGGGA